MTAEGLITSRRTVILPHLSQLVITLTLFHNRVKLSQLMDGPTNGFSECKPFRISMVRILRPLSASLAHLVPAMMESFLNNTDHNRLFNINR
jgi:hypothetical protein